MGVVNEGGTRAECEEGRAGGCGAARHICAHLGGVAEEASPCCCTTDMDSMARDSTTQRRATPTLCQPFLRVHAQVIKISED